MSQKILDAALKYASMGLAVFPVNPRNKHPYTPHGVLDAKKSLTVIREWWKRWPNANVAIACGQASGGLVVIDQDIDDDKGIDGINELDQWCRNHDVTIPDTWQAITGRGGYHTYFHSGKSGTFKNAVSLLDGVDIRTDGGYVVAPPSMHQNGKEYEWEYDPDEFTIAELPQGLEKLISNENKREEQKQFQLPERIPSGERNRTLFQLASSLQAKGLPDAAILSAVQEVNQSNCDVPLKDDEVKTIVSSAVKYKKGELRELQKSAGEYRSPKLKFTVDKNGEKKIVQSIENCCEAIEYDQDLWGHIRFNSLAYAPYIYSSLPWDSENSRKFREWSNVDDSNLKSYIEDKYGLKQLDKIMEALNIVANRHKYNPVIDLLNQCHDNWDGETGHIKKLLPDYLGVDDTDYQYDVIRIFMLGAISRAFTPGIKFDYMPVLVGGQGIGKSTFCRFLALNSEWFDDNFNTIDGDKAAEKLRGKWMVELAELLATKKSKDVEAIKAFITSRSDSYRPPYARRTEDRKRCCVFVGTTNSEHFLTDRTGNRRFLPVECHKGSEKKNLFGDEQAVSFDFVQAWGEAMEMFVKAGNKPSLILPKRSQEVAEKEQDKYLEDDPRIGQIQGWLDSLETDKYPRVCVPMIWAECFKLFSIPSKPEVNQIHEIMMNSIHGWHRMKGRQRVGGYGVQRAYERDNENEFIPIDDADTPF